MRILIAEDDAASRLILTRCLEMMGHSPLVTASGTEAWEVYQQCGADVVVSDWMMPGMDGLELCRQIRAAAAPAYTYVIILTALSEKEHFITAMEAGVDDYLSKPLDRDELQARLIAASRVTSLHRKLLRQQGELERLNQQLYEEGRKDALTGLRNRLAMREDLATMLDRVRRYRHSYCVALCDLDQYKAYNDHYGHVAGDEALKRVGEALGGATRIGDTVYRYGGEEFLILLPEQTLPKSVLVMNRLRTTIMDLGILHEASPQGVLTLSVGIASLFPDEEKSVDELLRQADLALYHAKHHGRNRVATYADGGCELSLA